LFFLFKYISEKKLETKLEEFFNVIKPYVDDDKKHNDIKVFIYYLMNILELSPEELSGSLNKISPKGGELIMTTAVKLRKEGMREKACEDARKMLEKGYPASDISEITGLSLEEIMKLKKENH